MLQKQVCRFVSVFIILLFWMGHAEAFTTLPPGPRPVVVQVGLYLDDILNVNEPNETLTFDATQTMRWVDARLAFDPQKVGARIKNYDTQAAQVRLLTMWHPQLTLLHGRAPRKVQQMHISVSSQGVVTWTEHFQATTEMHMNLRQFPFDSQVVDIGLYPFLHTVAQVQLQDWRAYSGVDQRAQMLGWRVHGFITEVTTRTSPLYRTLLSQYQLHIRYSRLPTYYIYQVFLPMALIVLLSFSVFWMLKNPLVNRVAISLTALLTIVVFQWRISEKLPRVAYHTFTDAFLLASFVVAASTIIASIYLEHKADLSDRCVRAFRIFYPIVYLLTILVVAFYFF